MATNSNIEWTTHTFNPWRGCTKVSEGCANCYASVNMGVKMHGVKWGPRGERVVKAESGWGEPLAWNRAAAAAGERHRVFCASLADVFEAADTMPAASVPVVAAARLRLLRLIYDTPHLDWLLLTKRPENIVQALQAAEFAVFGLSDSLDFCMWLTWWLRGNPPANVWLGTSVENQEQADVRISHLLAAPAAVRFLSCEPLLGPVALPLGFCNRCHAFTPTVEVNNGKDWGCRACGTYKGFYKSTAFKPDGMHCGIDWVIVGGESGPKARPMHLQWARDLRDQCQAAGVSFFFKQWGEYEPYQMSAQLPFWQDTKGQLHDGHGLAFLKGGELNTAVWHPLGDYGPVQFRKIGKHAAGRLLDGRTWEEMPAAPTAPTAF